MFKIELLLIKIQFKKNKIKLKQPKNSEKWQLIPAAWTS